MHRFPDPSAQVLIILVQSLRVTALRFAAPAFRAVRTTSSRLACSSGGSPSARRELRVASSRSRPSRPASRMSF
ncbi:hypothetical protein PF008_g30743, partial [Phytophthora fragariae]